MSFRIKKSPHFVISRKKDTGQQKSSARCKTLVPQRKIPRGINYLNVLAKTIFSFFFHERETFIANTIF